MRTGAQFLSLFILYVLLSGQVHSAKLMLLGAAGCAVITLILGRMRLLDEETLPIRMVLRSIPYAPWLAWQVVRANLDVAVRVWNPRLPISPCLVRVPHSLKTPVGITTYANSITLTPGTVTCQVGAHQFIVHALSQEAADGLFQSSMEHRIRRIEGSAP